MKSGMSLYVKNEYCEKNTDTLVSIIPLFELFASARSAAAVLNSRPRTSCNGVK